MKTAVLASRIDISLTRFLSRSLARAWLVSTNVIRHTMTVFITSSTAQPADGSGKRAVQISVQVSA
jgi:hypothetical protein